MNRTTILLSTGILLAMSAAPRAAPAVETNPVEAKLRETLRTTMTQLRTAQTEKAQAQAELQALQTKTDAEIKDLKGKLDDLTKRSVKEKTDADKALSDLKQAAESKEAMSNALAQAVEKWKASHAKVTDIARAKEAERARLAQKVADLERVVADRERRNLELFRVGNEILTRYENFSLGKAITAREPFTGITRARLQGLVQDYQDKLTDQLAKSGEPVAPVPRTTTPTPPAPSGSAATKSHSPANEPSPVPKP